MLSMYLLGIVVALLMAWLFKKTLLKGETPMLIMELPPYKRPLLRVVVRHMWDRSKLFLRRAGTVILGINILLWFLATYPHKRRLPAPSRRRTRRTSRANCRRPFPLNQAPAAPRRTLAALDSQAAGARLRKSFAGHLGRLIEPVIAPLGFDWKIGIGIITSFAAREVFVSTMSTVYNVGKTGHPSGMTSLAQTLKAQHARTAPLSIPPHRRHADGVLRLRLAVCQHGRHRPARNQFLEVAALPVVIHGRLGLGIWPS
jgi:ferrous iron transport protein B